MAKYPFPGTVASQFFSLPAGALGPRKRSVLPSAFWTGWSRDPSEGKGWPLARPEAFSASYSVRDQKFAAGTSFGSGTL